MIIIHLLSLINKESDDKKIELSIWTPLFTEPTKLQGVAIVIGNMISCLEFAENSGNKNSMKYLITN